MILAFPYHDPDGKYNKIFKKNISLLKTIFNQIIVSVTPDTHKENAKFIQHLIDHGITIYKNSSDSCIGDHFRNALLVAVTMSNNKENILFSFIDRILFILESQHREDFINDINQSENDYLTIFERSKKAWNTHPTDYRQIEKFINSLLAKLSGINIEMNFCAIILNRNIAKKILSGSYSQGWEVVGEWLLLSMKLSIPFLTKKVNWLSWEDPFWGNDKDEILKRIKTNFPFLQLLIEDRFKEIYLRGDFRPFTSSKH